jgi:hypothetical protein
MVDRLRGASQSPIVIEAQKAVDCSAEQHRTATMFWYSEANLDAALAETLYSLDLEPIAHPYYEDVPETLRRIKAKGIGVAIVSDIHFDLRPESQQQRAAAADRLRGMYTQLTLSVRIWAEAGKGP